MNHLFWNQTSYFFLPTEIPICFFALENDDMMKSVNEIPCWTDVYDFRFESSAFVTFIEIAVNAKSCNVMQCWQLYWRCYSWKELIKAFNQFWSETSRLFGLDVEEGWVCWNVSPSLPWPGGSMTDASHSGWTRIFLAWCFVTINVPPLLYNMGGKMSCCCCSYCRRTTKGKVSYAYSTTDVTDSEGTALLNQNRSYTYSKVHKTSSQSQMYNTRKLDPRGKKLQVRSYSTSMIPAIRRLSQNTYSSTESDFSGKSDVEMPRGRRSKYHTRREAKLFSERNLGRGE